MENGVKRPQTGALTLCMHRVLQLTAVLLLLDVVVITRHQSNYYFYQIILSIFPFFTFNNIKKYLFIEIYLFAM